MFIKHEEIQDIFVPLQNKKSYFNFLINIFHLNVNKNSNPSNVSTMKVETTTERKGFVKFALNILKRRNRFEKQQMNCI